MRRFNKKQEKILVKQWLYKDQGETKDEEVVEKGSR